MNQTTSKLEMTGAKEFVFLLLILLWPTLSFCQYEGGSGRQEALSSTTVLHLNNGQAAATSQLVVVQQPHPMLELSQQFILKLEYRTASGHLAYFETGNVSLTFQTNPTGATLGGTTTLAATAGVVEFSGLSVDKTGTGYELLASGASSTSATSNAFSYFSLGIGGSGRQEALGEISPVTTLSGEIFWVGGLGGTPTDWSDRLNWRPNTAVPGSSDHLAMEPNNNGHNPILDQDRTIYSMNFNGAKKKLELGNFNLTLSETITGTDADNYIQTNGTGQLLKNLGSSQTFTFPVGNTAYNPVTITNKTGSADIFSVRVLNEVYWKGTTGGIATTPRVMRTWLIDKNTANSSSGDGVDFEFSWNTGEATAGLNTPRLYHFDGTQWQVQRLGFTSYTSNSLAYTGYKGTFSPFAIGDDIVLLPVTWLDFRCQASQNGSGLLQWRTAMEQNTRAFKVERSAEGQTYQTIGEVPAAGNSQTVRTYSFSDLKPLPSGGYYRIKMEDIQGNISYSDVCNLKNNDAANPAPLKVYPNPTHGQLYMIALEPERNFTWEVFSMAGKMVANGNSRDGKAVAKLTHLSEGVYQLRVSGSGLSENHRIFVRN